MLAFEWYFSRMIEEVLEGKNAKILSQSLHEYGLSFFAKSDAGYPQKPLYGSHKEHQEARQKWEEEFFAEIDKDLLRVKDDHELKMLVQLLMHTVFSTIAEAYRELAENHAYDPSLATTDFNNKISWLRDGAQKERGKRMTKLIKRVSLVSALMAVAFMVVQVIADLYLPTLTSNIINNGVATGDIDYIWRTGFLMIGFH